MISIFPCDSRTTGIGVFLRLLLGELGTPKPAQIFAHGKWLYPYRMILHGASDLDQRCLKTRNSKNGCTFPPNIFTPTPNIPKTPFWGPFIAKRERELSVSHTLMELWSWNFTATLVSASTSVCQKFSARPGVHGRAQGYLMLIWDPLLSRKLLELESWN